MVWLHFRGQESGSAFGPIASKIQANSLGLGGGKKKKWEEMTWPNGTNPHTIFCKYLISPCCAQCVTGRYGYLKFTKNFQRHFNTTKEYICNAIQSWCTNPSGKIPTTNLPTTALGMPWGAYDRCITPSVQEVKEAASLKEKCPVTAASWSIAHFAFQK